MKMVTTGIITVVVITTIFVILMNALDDIIGLSSSIENVACCIFGVLTGHLIRVIVTSNDLDEVKHRITAFFNFRGGQK